MENKKFIRDSIHGDLPISSFELEILDYPQIQRLRRIKQLGFIYLIYPGANHSRFEHSIGTMYLGGKLAEHLNLDEYQQEIVRIAALLHDVGHGPFSHVSEGVLDVPHEKVTAHIIKNTSIRDKLSEKFNIKDIIDIINGDGPLGPIVSGELDVDRMDYLRRDSHFTGVAYGVIDIERIISNLKLEKFLVLDIKGVQAAESTLVSRYFMYPSVYQHHTTRIINAMFRRCLKYMIKTDQVDVKEMCIYDDVDLIAKVRSSEGYSREILEKIDNRNLFKKVDGIKLNEFKNPNEIFKISKAKLLKAEEEIAEDYSIDAENVILNLPEFPRFDEMKTQVSIGNNLYHLNEISSIVQALNKARFNYPDIALCVPKENRNDFDKFKFDHYLDLPEKSDTHLDKFHVSQKTLFD